MCVLPVTCLMTMCVCHACGGQKRASDGLELELQLVVTNHVDAGNRSQVLWKNSKVLLITEPSLWPQGKAS